MRRRKRIVWAGRRSFWLWSANGERVTTLQDCSGPSTPPLFVVHDNRRYVRMDHQSATARVVHYWTRAIVPRDAVTVPA